MEMPAPRALLRNSKAVRWAVGISATIMVAIGIVLLFLLTVATNNRELYELAEQPKELVLYPGCGHGLDECREKLDRDLLEWLLRVTPKPEPVS